MAPYEAFYGQHCGSPFCQYEVGESRMYKVGLIDEVTDKVKIIKERLQAT